MSEPVRRDGFADPGAAGGLTNDPPGTVIRTFDDATFRVVCADGEAYAVCTLEPGDVFFDEQTPNELAFCVVASGYRRGNGRYEIRAVPESNC